MPGPIRRAVHPVANSTVPQTIHHPQRPASTPAAPARADTGYGRWLLEWATGRPEPAASPSAAAPSAADRMPTVRHALNEAAEAVDIVRSYATEAEAEVHEALGRALITIRNEGLQAVAQHAWAQGTQAAGHGLPPQQTVGDLLRAAPGTATQAAETVRRGAASAEAAVHEVVGRVLTTLAQEGPVSAAQQLGVSLVAATRWAVSTLAQAPSAAAELLPDRKALPHGATLAVLRAAAHIYRAAREVRQTAGAIAGELGGEAMRMMDVVDQELCWICVSAIAAADVVAAEAVQSSPEEHHEAELQAFKATLLGFGLDEVQDLVDRLSATTDPADAERAAVAREFLTLQWAAAAGGPDAYLRGFEAERMRLSEQVRALEQKRAKITPSRVLPHAVLPDRYRDKHHEEATALESARARMAQIDETTASVTADRQQITDLQMITGHVQGTDAGNLASLTSAQLARCEQLLREAITAADNLADTTRLQTLMQRVLKEPKARSMLDLLRAGGAGVLYAKKDEADRLVTLYEAQYATFAPGWQERWGLWAPDPERAAEFERLAGQLAEARAVSAERAELVFLYQSADYAQRTARTEALHKALRDQEFHRQLMDEYDAARDRVSEQVNTKLVKLVDILLQKVRSSPEGLGQVPTNILKGLAERLPTLVAAAGPFYLEHIDFALLQNAVAEELAARRTV